MANMNRLTIIGNVGKEPELRYMQSGKPVVNFSVAATEHWTDKQTNEKREKTQWVKVTAWDKLAETINTYVTKGMSVLVEGPASVEAYTDKDGKPAASLVLTAQSIQFLSRKDSDGSAAGDTKTSNTPDIGNIPF